MDFLFSNVLHFIGYFPEVYLFAEVVSFIEFLSGGIGIIELLDNSNLVAIVGGGTKPFYSPNSVFFSFSYYFLVTPLGW